MILLRIAVLNVIRYRRRSLLTAFAVTMSVFVMMCVRGMINGSERMAFDQMILGQYGALQVHKKGFLDNVNKMPLTFAFPIDDAFMQKLRAVPGVRDATARITFPTMLSVGDKTVVSVGMAIDPAHEYDVTPLKLVDILEGERVTPTTAVFSPQVKRQLGLDVKTEVTLLSPDAEGVMNAALINAGGFLNDIPALTTAKKIVYIPLPLAQELLRLPGQAVEIALRATDGADLDGVRDALQKVVGEGYEVNTWRDRSAMVLDASAQRRQILGWVSAIFFMIAMIGVINTMLMSVLSRTREIGTMMAVGMRRRRILAMFIAEAVVIGLIGAIGGVLVGEALAAWLGARGIEITPPAGGAPLMLRPFIEWGWALTTGLSVALAAGVASMYPAFRAARLKPIEAMSAL